MALVIGKKHESSEIGHSCEPAHIFFNNLSDCMLFEILIRVPVQSAVQYKTVCRRWYQLISSHYFISRSIHHGHLYYYHHTRSQSQSRPWSTLVFQYRYSEGRPVRAISEHPLLSNRYHECNINMSFLPCYNLTSNSNHRQQQPVQVEIVASCDDLLLCSYTDPEDQIIYYICNLLTRQWVELPPAPEGSVIADVGFVWDPLPCSLCDSNIQRGLGFGLGFSCHVSSNAHYRYKVVRVLRPSDGNALIYNPPLSKVEIHVFCSDSSQWNKFVVNLCPRKLFLPPFGTHLVAHDRKLFWVAGSCIVALDPFRCPEAFCHRVIGLPLKESGWGSYKALGACQGCILLARITSHDINPTLRVWKLGDCNRSKWHLHYRIRLENLVIRGTRLVDSQKSFRFMLIFKVLAFHPNEMDVLYFQLRHTVIRYNLKTGRQEFYKFHSPNRRFMEYEAFGWHNAFPLVHHWVPSPVPSLTSNVQASSI
ncbi:hypothetical protein Ancab_004515 [Ancistrocladus abbreviatus]